LDLTRLAMTSCRGVRIRMNRRRLCWLLLLLLPVLLAGAGAAAADTDGLYDTPTLQAWHARYSRSMERILGEGILPRLSEKERRALTGVKIELPLRDDVLINFYAEERTVVLPVSALKLLDDLSIAYAWLWANNYQLEPVEEYVAMLKHKKTADFPGGRYPPPLVALKIPPTALQDRRVDELSLRLFNSARAFVLAHELAHIYYGHGGRSLANEEQADQFAMDVMRRTSTVPMGVVLFFQATALWFRDGPANHPLNGQRLRVLARRLDGMAGDFAQPGRGAADDTERIRFIGRGLERVADYLDDTDLQRCVAESASRASPAILRPRARSAPSFLDCTGPR
jgi:hypothetical protein